MFKEQLLPQTAVQRAFFATILSSHDINIYDDMFILFIPFPGVVEQNKYLNAVGCFGACDSSCARQGRSSHGPYRAAAHFR